MSSKRRFYFCVLLLCTAYLQAGCATTASGNLPPPIPEGKGHLILEAGGIKQLNFSVINQETQETVYSVSPRPSPLSPSGYERNIRKSQTHAYLDPGTYTIVVNTALEYDTIEIPDVEIVLGEQKWVPVQVGKFMLNVMREGTPTQARFVVYDYQMRTLLGQGMTSTQVRHFIARPGLYKVRIEMLGGGSHIDTIREVKVNMGSVTPVFIELMPSFEPDADPVGG